MNPATGPWQHSPETPDDPKKLCLVLLEDRQQGRTYQVMRFVRRQWYFPGNMVLSGNQRVICWAPIHEDPGKPETQAVSGKASVHGAR